MTSLFLYFYFAIFFYFGVFYVHFCFPKCKGDWVTCVFIYINEFKNTVDSKNCETAQSKNKNCFFRCERDAGTYKTGQSDQIFNSWNSSTVFTFPQAHGCRFGCLNTIRYEPRQPTQNNLMNFPNSRMIGGFMPLYTSFQIKIAPTRAANNILLLLFFIGAQRVDWQIK